MNDGAAEMRGEGAGGPRVALVADHYPPAAPGGAEWSIAGLAAALAPACERLVVAVTADGDGPAPPASEAGHHASAASPVRWRAPLRPRSRGGSARPWALANPLFTLATAARLARLGRRERIELLHAQSHASLTATWLAARLLRVPVIATLRDCRTLCEPAICLHTHERVPADCGYSRLIRRCVGEFLDRAAAPRGRRRLRPLAEFSWLWLDNRWRWQCLRRCDGVVGVSRALLEIYRERGLIDPARSIARAIPTPAPAPPADAAARRIAARQALGAGDGPLLVYVGKHSLGKGTALLRRAWSELAPRFPRATLVLAGADHPPAEHPGERVLRPQPHERALDLILAADLVVSAAVGPESLGRTLVEAAGMGVPVLATRAGGSPELVAAGGGLLVERGDWRALARGLERFLSDPRLGDRLRPLQRAAAAGILSGEAVRDAHLQLYREVIGRRRAQSPKAARLETAAGALR
jgi:glycosyltransferase involved in cell wall biosynthesis